MSGFSDSVEEVKMAFDKGEHPRRLSWVTDFGRFGITCLHFFFFFVGLIRN